MVTAIHAQENQPMIPPRPQRGARRLAALLALALTACSAASRDAVLACSASADCGPGARCLDGACQASTPPSADFALPAALTTNRAFAVTASATDRDPGDAIASFAWTITRTSAGCDADADVADAATLQAVFWCAGTYEISLTVTDAAGATSTPVRRTATVTALDGAPTVTAGPALEVEHRCAGEPLRCELALPVALAADGQSPLGGPLTYRWTALPPDGSRAGAVPALAPSASAQAPTLSITTDGGALSGSWRLRVRVEDAHGNLAQAVQRIVVGNRPPVVDGTQLELDHRYAAGTYEAGGPLAPRVSDPDGDPVEVALAAEEPAGSGCSAALSDVTPAGGRYALSCPAPGGLLATGRALRASVVDVNGATASVAVPVLVRNRLPVVRPAAGVGLGALELDHSVGPCPGGAGACFTVAAGNPFVAEDPDGDPVTEVTLVPLVDAARPSSAGAVIPGPGGGSFRFTTPVAAPAEFRAATGESGFWLTATASDPFGASAPAQPALPIRIRNRPPVATMVGAGLTAPHRYDAGAAAYEAAAPLAAFTDPDGDPVDAGASSGDEACGDFSAADGVVSVACVRPWAINPASYPTLSGFSGAHALVARASDGWDTATVPVTLTVGNGAPSLVSYTGAIDACACQCPKLDPEVPGACMVDFRWVADARQATFPLRPEDPDGDPMKVTFTVLPGSAAGASVTPAARTGLSASCGATLSTSGFPVSVKVTANDGVSQAEATWIATSVTCAKAGQVCTP
jgi:PKD repeat protein